MFEVGHSGFEAIAFVLSAFGFFDDSRDQSGDGFDHGHRCDFSAEEDELTERNFLES